MIINSLNQKTHLKKGIIFFIILIQIVIKKFILKNQKAKKINKRILKNPTDFSSDKGKVRYNTDLNDDFDFIIKSKGIKIK